jgi:hypothetical protein
VTCDNCPAEPVFGCTNDSACNYDPDATDDDGSCEENDCAGECGGSAELDECGVCDGDSSSCSGCTDSSADNYDESATIDFGCEYSETVEVSEDGTTEEEIVVSTGNEGTEMTIESGTQILLDGEPITGEIEISVSEYSGEEEVVDVPEVFETVSEIVAFEPFGVTFSDPVEIILSYDNLREDYELMTLDNPSDDTWEIVEGADCTSGECIADVTSFGLYSVIEVVDNEYVEGCTDESACNYDADANVDNGSCLQLDCTGECGGSAIVDECGLCDSDSTNDCSQDCAGIWGGNALVDLCGICDGDNSTCTDCNGDVNGSAFIDDCDECVGGNTGIEECSSSQTVEIDLHPGANLVSLYALPEDRSISNIMSSLDGIVTGVIGEGLAASPNPVLGWVGSLSEFSETSGYWVKVNDHSTLVVNDATPLDPELVYDLHSGANLISFPYEGSVGIAEAIPDDAEALVTGIIGEGVAASPNPVLGWVGSLSSFQGTKGYWMKMSDAASFSFNIPDGLVRSSNPVEIQKSPIGFEYDQSTLQAFYFIENIVLDGESIQDGDWVMAYNGNVLVGAREWNGAYTDIPVMGYDSQVATAGYIENGQKPVFKVIRGTTGESFIVSGDIPAWANNELYTIGVMENVTFPSTIVLQEAYPNPFNPSTKIEFGLSDDTNINVSVYDISGREIAVLAEGRFSKGFHNIIWNAAGQPSGIYFASVSNHSETQIQKLILIK